jgi:uncharacterized membrane protein
MQLQAVLMAYLQRDFYNNFLNQTHYIYSIRVSPPPNEGKIVGARVVIGEAVLTIWTKTRGPVCLRNIAAYSYC